MSMCISSWAGKCFLYLTSLFFSPRNVQNLAYVVPVDLYLPIWATREHEHLDGRDPVFYKVHGLPFYST